MSSERRIQSSRANGALSQGPTTPPGKSRSVRNRTRHGLLAQTIVLAGEKPASFKALLAAFETELQPRTQIETSCVETMAVARWRLMRLWGMEKASLQHEMSKQDPGQHDPATHAALAFRALCDESNSANLLNRYETRYDRQYTRALNLLLKFRGGANENFHSNPVPNSDTGSPVR
jgi:hypothetical protein